MSGQVIWLTGLSGSGKTTLGTALLRHLAPRRQGILIDGDRVRILFQDDLGFSEAARHTQIGRVQRLAQWLGEQGQLVVVAALYSHPDLLAWNRKNLPGYFEVYLDMPLDLVRARDAKGLYAAAAAGQAKDVVGVDIPWHAPLAPDLVITPGELLAPDPLAAWLAARIPGLVAAS
jgi:adenylylsulfate kinase-like enzyme